MKYYKNANSQDAERLKIEYNYIDRINSWIRFNKLLFVLFQVRKTCVVSYDEWNRK